MCDKSYLQLNKFQRKISMPLKVLLFKNNIAKKQLKGKYDVEIAFLEGPITRIFNYKNKNVKKIAWIHNDISQVFGKGFKSKLKRILDNKIYSKYDKLIFVSKDNMQKFNEIYPDINVDKQVIYNYIDKEKVLRKAEDGQDIKFD